MFAALAVVLALTLVPGDVPGQSGRTAEDAVERAVTLHAEGKLAEASAVIADAYALYPDRDLLFMRGVIERERENCDLAVELFQAFIAEHPSLAEVEAADQEIQLCRESDPTPPPAVSEPPPTPEVSSAAQPPPTPRVLAERPPSVAAEQTGPSSRPWTRDRPGGALLGIGLVLATGGVVSLVLADRRAGTAAQAETAGDYRQQRSLAQNLSGVGWPALGLGVCSLIGSVLRYTFVARRTRGRP